MQKEFSDAETSPKVVWQSRHLNTGSSSLDPDISTRYSSPMIGDWVYESSFGLKSKE
jgi:hypothetical protein